MALATLPMAFKVNLKTLQTFEISHLGANTTNINIWILVSFSHNFLYFSQIDPRNTLQGFEIDFKDLVIQIQD